MSAVAKATLLGMPNKRSRRSASEMDRIREAIHAAAQAEHPVTCRRLFYKLVAEGVIEKTEAQYQGTVIRLLSEMREAGEIPFAWIADHTRLMRRPTRYGSLSDALERTAKFYRRDLWDEQDCYVEVWCEKAGLTGVLYPETSSWDVPLMICSGSPSKTFLYESASYIVAQGKPAFLYYLGDHDPSGVAIRERVERDLRRYADGFVGGKDVEICFRHLAVTLEQIDEWHLPTRPTKKSDPNAKRFDGESVEVDAIPAGELREMVETAIIDHIDDDRLSRLRNVEKAERETLQGISARYRGILS